MSAVIHGIVRDRAGVPVSQARVYFVSGPDPFPDIAALTSEEGRFSLSAPSPGAYLIECNAEGFATEVIGVHVEGQEEGVEILLGPA
ncbi:MAG TPA: carboxypeptidase-like regulatory domain-containing protein [Actinomycetota bacterium]|nr:carboxypeptidase-like regulatory domain-containing protein [Actinomycetota bacterium]